MTNWSVPDYTGFAKAWEAAWNSHSLARIMAHYAPDVVFRSQKAQALVGTGVLQGHAELRAYWRKALECQPDLHFRVVDVFHGFQSCVITYNNHKSVFAAETLHFGSDGLVIQASACHQQI